MHCQFCGTLVVIARYSSALPGSRKTPRNLAPLADACPENSRILVLELALLDILQVQQYFPFRGKSAFKILIHSSPPSSTRQSIWPTRRPSRGSTTSIPAFASAIWSSVLDAMSARAAGWGSATRGFRWPTGRSCACCERTTAMPSHSRLGICVTRYLQPQWIELHAGYAGLRSPPRF